MSKRKTKQMTANQRAYLAEVKRIKQAVKRLEKRGYRFSDDVIPQMPKRVTKKAIKEIQKLKTKDLYEKATALDEETGEIIGGLEKRQIEHQERARKSAQTRKRKKKKEEQREPEQEQYYPNGGDIIVSNILDEFILKLQEADVTVYTMPNGRTYRKKEEAIEASRRSKHTLLSLTYSVINEIGRAQLGWRLAEHTDEVMRLTDYVLYGSDSARINSACAELASIINGGSLTMEQTRDLAEQEEYNESYGEELYE